MANTTYMRSVNIGDGNDHCGNITSSFNKTYNMSDEDAQIMHWLSPLEPRNRHQDVRTDRFDGVGDWVLETNEFRKWRSGETGVDGAVLFCSGNPGVGKTCLSSLVIDSLCDKARGGSVDVTVTGFYCDFPTQREQTITNMMGVILKQLVGGDIPTDVREAFEKSRKEFGGRGLRLPELMAMLKTTIAGLAQVFICIDALDECLPEYLSALLKSLQEIIRESPGTRIFLTGRPHVGEDVQRVFAKAAVIPISPNTDDIRSYLEMKLGMDSASEAMNDDLRADILRIIPEKISEIFLLVSLNIDAILGEMSVLQRRKKLDEMAHGNGLSDAYTKTLDRLKAQKGKRPELGLKVLMWVSHSERPLLVQELCHALGVEIGSADLNIENVPALRTLLACSLGLVTVEKSSSTVRLLHYTLQEHLSKDTTLFDRPHSIIAQVCLTYLDSRSIRDLSPIVDSTPPTSPFLEYASYYWGQHARRDMTDNVKTLTLRLLDGFDHYISAGLMFLRHGKTRSSIEPYFLRQSGLYGFKGLHAAAYLGMPVILAALLEMKRWDVNATDSTGATVLGWAARMGHEGVVGMLLEREDVNTNSPDAFGQTPLLRAAVGGHEGVVRMLLEREDVNINTPDKDGKTSLSWAVENGHEGVVKLLLDQGDVNSEALNKENQTPLSLDLSGRHDEAVRSLPEGGKQNPDTSAPNSQTSSSPSLGRRDESAIETQSLGDDFIPDITNLNDRQVHPSAEPNEPEGVLNRKDSISVSTDGDLPLAELSRLPQPPSNLPPMLSPSARKLGTHSYTTQLTLTIPINWYLIIASFVCLLAIFVYALSSSSSKLFSFYK